MKQYVAYGLIGAALACVAGVVFFRVTRPTGPETPSIQFPATADTHPPKPIAPSAVQSAAVPEGAPPASPPASGPTPATAPPAPAAPPNSLTAQTLKGTRWKDQAIDVVFMADGQWQMNGRICAKWEVQGNRIRIFDDKGEEHFVNIAGDSLEFNGKKIARVNN